MESRRQQKVASLLKDSMATYFMKKRGDFLGNRVLVSILSVSVTSDMGFARFYVSFLPDKEKQAMVDALNANVRKIRADIAKDLRHALRVIPVIEFYLDDSIAHASHMEELFKKLREEGEL